MTTASGTGAEPVPSIKIPLVMVMGPVALLWCEVGFLDLSHAMMGHIIEHKKRIRMISLFMISPSSEDDL
jgi:hypothetical protein